jgi:hypothetical protein
LASMSPADGRAAFGWFVMGRWGWYRIWR